MTQTKTARVVNFAIYEIGWFACVLGGANGQGLLGASVALILVAIHLYLTTQRLTEIKLIGFALAVGLTVDCSLLAMGVFRFPDSEQASANASWFPPWWMPVLWIQFATTFRYCMNWLRERYVVCALLGMFGAPLAFLGGERMGAVIFLEPRVLHLATLGLMWSVALVTLFSVTNRLQRGRSLPSYRLSRLGPSEQI